MEQELTIQQAREIARLRRRHAGADLVAHEKPWGVIVEARRGGHAIELTRFDWTGNVSVDRPIQIAA